MIHHPQTMSIDPLVAAWEGEHARLAVTFDPSDIGANKQHYPRHYMLRSFPSTHPHSLLILLSKSFSPHLSHLPSPTLPPPLNSTQFKSPLTSSFSSLHFYRPLYFCVGVVHDVLTVSSPLWGEYVCDIVAVCVPPLPQGPYMLYKGTLRSHCHISAYLPVYD